MRYLFLLLLIATDLRASSPSLQALGRDFFRWRAVTQPATFDDVNRVERPDGWKPDWSPGALKKFGETNAKFRDRLQKLSRKGWTVSDSVDYLLLRSAIARVDFELNVVRSARKNPLFYVQQTLGAVYELILQPPPFSEDRARNIVIRLESIPKTIGHAKGNLTESVPAFAELTIGALKNVEEQLTTFSREMTVLLPEENVGVFTEATAKASDALVSYREWLQQKLPRMKGTFAIGPKAYDRFLKEIALMPFTGNDLLMMGKLEWDRSVAFDHFASLRNRDESVPAQFTTAAEEIEAHREMEESLREFLVERDILDVPSWLGHFANMEMPAYLAPMSWLGVTADHTSPSRLGENATSYRTEPTESMGFFRQSSAQDPRPLLIHEGIPGHFFQLSVSWANPDTIRQNFFDSGPIEGLAFYAEEMMMQHGYLDDNTRSREIIYRFMRLRALRVEVDVKLSRGDFTIEQAGRYLAETVPMDEETAMDEAVFFATNPGQAISYQIGKVQIVNLIADAVVRKAGEFNLRELHNYIWINGNVPIALLRWEYLGLRDDVKSLW